MHLSSVLLPEPERPKITTTSPRATSRSTPLSTSFSPKNLWTLAQAHYRMGVSVHADHRPP